MPLSADLLGLCGRGDRAPRPVGRRMDGRGAHLPLPSLGRLGVSIRRPTQFRAAPRGRGPGATDAGVSAATECGLPRRPPAFMDVRHSDTAARDFQHGRAAPRRRQHPRPASRAGASSSSRRVSTTRSAHDLLAGANRALEAAGASHDLVSASLARSRFPPAWRSRSTRRKPPAGLTTARSRSAASCAARTFISKSSPANRRGR